MVLPIEALDKDQLAAKRGAAVPQHHTHQSRHAGKSSTSKAHTAVECCAHTYRGCYDHSSGCAAGGERANLLEEGDQVTVAGSLGAYRVDGEDEDSLNVFRKINILTSSRRYRWSWARRWWIRSFTRQWGMI